ncbi:MAG: aminoacyl-tRNA hydrolase [Phycisphaerales bacterium]
MKIIAGLGNPGAGYERTRHNAGFMAVDRLLARVAPAQHGKARFQSLTWEATLPGAGKCLLMKPVTYMNLSGRAVSEALRFYKADPAEDLLVLVDDVALPVGSIRIRASGGAGGHNGLSDIQRHCGGEAYARLRIGVDPPGRIPQADYVLGKFSPEQWDALQPALERSADATEKWASEGVLAAMNEFNSRAAAGDADPWNTSRASRDDQDNGSSHA